MGLRGGNVLRGVGRNDQFGVVFPGEIESAACFIEYLLTR